jgi:DNA invertase Pin-like site-specific DNA recombinase
VGRALAGMLAVVAEFAREILRQRVTAGMAQVRRRGTRHGRPSTVAHHAGTVWQLAAAGFSTSAMARQLSIRRA